MLNLIQVQSFIAVIEKGGFQEAARHLQVSQPTISQHVKKLEEQLGVSLIQRVRGEIAPTSGGSVFLPFAQRLVKGAARSVEAIKGIPLMISASSNPGIYLLPPFVRGFQTRNVDVPDVEFRIGNNAETLACLESGEADLAVLETWDDRPDYEAVIWRREPLVVIVAPTHPWATRRQVSSHELVGQTILGGESGSGTGRALRAGLGQLASRLSVGNNLGSTDAVKHAVAASLGISVVMEACVTSEVRDGRLKALEIEDAKVAKDVFIVIPSETPSNSAAREFVSYLLEDRSIRVRR